MTRKVYGLDFLTGWAVFAGIKTRCRREIKENMGGVLSCHAKNHSTHHAIFKSEASNKRWKDKKLKRQLPLGLHPSGRLSLDNKVKLNLRKVVEWKLLDMTRGLVAVLDLCPRRSEFA